MSQEEGGVGGGGGGGGLKRLDWTTWDELLLACAVERHGSKDWDLVAVELQARSSLPLSAQTCKTKFFDLNRRFMNDGNAVGRSYSSSVPWIEDLRKLRVAELRQEVHLHDLSIQKLQLKVERLVEEEEEEERDRELKESGGDDDEKPDLRDASHEDASENNKNEAAAAVREGTSPATAVGDGSDRENLSFNESNSSQNRSREDEPAENGVEPNLVTSDSKPAEEDSSNDSSDTIAKHAPPSSKANRAEKSGNSAEFPESATNSTKGNNKDSSDVQSSASLSMKRRRLANEPVVSPATMKREAVKSEPLIGFLDVIRSHKHSSLFERRLQNQKTEEYNEIIRQHIDLETIGRRVAAKSSDSAKFYRDLLLLFTNFITFFPKSSKESTAAHQLRALVLKEIRNKMTTSTHTHLHSIDHSSEDVPDATLLTKTRPPSAPIVVCRKRSSSISGKSREELDSPTKEKPVTTGTRSLRRGIKSRPAASKLPQVPVAPAAEDKSTAIIPSSPEKKAQQMTSTNSSSRKRGAADFLKRIKRNASPVRGSSSSSSLLERLKSEEAAAAASKKIRGTGDRKKKELPPKRSGGGTTKQETSPLKKPANGKSQPVRRGRETAAKGGGGGGTTKRRREEADTPPPNAAKKRTRR